MSKTQGNSRTAPTLLGLCMVAKEDAAERWFVVEVVGMPVRQPDGATKTSVRVVKAGFVTDEEASEFRDAMNERRFLAASRDA